MLVTPTHRSTGRSSPGPIRQPAAAPGGDYPFAFDCPDAATHHALTLPATLTAQIAAFAQQITVHESREAYDAAQVAQGLSYESRSFIPSGLISPSGEPVTPPESHALIAGEVVEAGERRNAVTDRPFWWALVDTVGGTFDAVIDPSLLSNPVRAGNVISRVVLAVGSTSEERGAARCLASQADRPRIEAGACRRQAHGIAVVPGRQDREET